MRIAIMPAMAQPMMMRRPFVAVAAQQGKAAKQLSVPRMSDTRNRRIAAAGKPYLRLLLILSAC